MTRTLTCNGHEARVALLGLDDTLGDAIAQSLSRDGCAMTRAPCATSAVPRLCECCPDVIVLETRTSDMSAFGVAQAIRQNRDLDHARLLVLQNSGRAIDKRRARAMGADGFLSMPFPMSSLRIEVGRLLEA
ncbi:two-component system response regulator [Meridianimarinicoccus sp. MJW13]|uniref:response regulator n=1 Tax=Meridianimarinicoccus sp. MJW13 TaxID=2720031 RepID=UPI0018683F38|nr:hypothetical protein [Fluviibacterium sp. MJW13]